MIFFSVEIAIMSNQVSTEHPFKEPYILHHLFSTVISLSTIKYKDSKVYVSNEGNTA